MTPDLYEQSLRIIATHQAANGAYPACPNFPTYGYSWFRDGAFIAHAMDLAGQHESARRFHDWAARTVLLHRQTVERAIERANRGETLGEHYLHTRYTLDGEIGDEEWPNFQLDGLGAWLWAIAEHRRRVPQDMPVEWEAAIGLVARYLAALWAIPCYDLWEEHPESLHPSTLAAIYAGLRAAGELRGAGGRPPAADDPRPSEAARRIQHFVLERGVVSGRLVKSIPPQPGGAAGTAASGVDASLIAVATPYRLLPPDHPTMRATVARIEQDLHYPGGGIYRYRGDTYYGGGEWVLLAAWLGWYYVEVGERERARGLYRWVEAQANARGELPEQVSTHLLAPEYLPEWETRWGPVARPLLWSHAMYLILDHALKG